MVAVTIYTTTYCAYCVRAKELFRRKGVAFEEIDVTDDTDRRAWLVQETGRWTVPQIFIGGRPYGGYTDVAKLERSGELDALLFSGERPSGTGG